MAKRKVLFVDDDADYLESMKLFLQKEYDVTTALSAQEGYERLKGEKPALIILDAMMEPKNGFDFAKELKAHPDYKAIPIVMLTAVASNIPGTKYSHDDVLRFAGEEFVDKSDGKDELLAAVKKLI